MSTLLLRVLTCLLSCTIRSWTGKETTTRTSSRRPTLAFVKPLSQMRRRTRLCLPEHSRTKPSMCTGSRKSAGRAARVRQRAAQRARNGSNRCQQLEEEKTFAISGVFVGLQSLVCSPAVSLLIISEHRLLRLRAGSTWRLRCFG